MKMNKKVKLDPLKGVKKPISKKLSSKKDSIKKIKAISKITDDINPRKKLKKPLKKFADPSKIKKESIKTKSSQLLSPNSSAEPRLSSKKKLKKFVTKSTKLEKIDKEKVKEISQEPVALDISADSVSEGVNVVLSLHKAFLEKKNLLLLTDKSPLFLQINLIKVPEVAEASRKYLKLDHSIWGSDADICLFVQDLKVKDKVPRTPDEKIELSVEYYENILKIQEIEGITAIMPAFQLMTEYDSFELKRKLVEKFDVFLCQSTLLEDGKFIKHVGNSFTKKNKVPLVVKFPSHYKTPNPKFKQHISDLLHSTWFQLRAHSCTFSTVIGNLSMKPEELTANIVRVLAQLNEKNVIPGGTANIKSLLLKSSRSPAVPLYISLASSNSVATPKVKSKRPRLEQIEDEVSTMPGRKVSILPTGDVFVVPDENFKPPPGWSDEDFSDGEEDASPPKKKKQQKKKLSKLKNGDSGSSSEDEDQAEVTEQHYLEKQNENSDIPDDEDNTSDGIKKKRKVIKKNKKVLPVEEPKKQTLGKKKKKKIPGKK